MGGGLLCRHRGPRSQSREPHATLPYMPFACVSIAGLSCQGCRRGTRRNGSIEECGGPSAHDAGRKSHLTADTEEAPIVREGFMRPTSRIGTRLVDLPRKAPEASRVFADGGYGVTGCVTHCPQGLAGLDRDCRETQGCQGVRRSSPPSDCGEDQCLDGPVPSMGQGLRAHRGKFPGPGQAGGVPSSHATGGT